MFYAALSLTAYLTLPVEFGSITLERAHTLSGRLVVAEFLNEAEPIAYPDFGQTHIGPRNRDDCAERIAVLHGIRYDLKAGERIRVV